MDCYQFSSLMVLYLTLLKFIDLSKLETYQNHYFLLLHWPLFAMFQILYRLHLQQEVIICRYFKILS